ncbi:hypothetical protein JTB14_013926 [Gonioctena quinquepunctata]|nr:hypothetical protein JTB14_013926 [Gonioctena quinquepunctata]
MVARSFSVQDVSYSRLLQVQDDERDFITLEELKPAIVQQQQPQHYQPTYYELTNMVDDPCSSSLSYQSNQNSGSAMDIQCVDSSSLTSSNRKRKTYFRRDVEPGTRAHGGIAILIRNNFPAMKIPLRTDIQALAVHIDYDNLTICNIYLPNTDWTIAALQNIIEQLPSPFLIMGDFNSHNPIWGSHKQDAGGRIIGRVIDDRD